MQKQLKRLVVCLLAICMTVGTVSVYGATKTKTTNEFGTLTGSLTRSGGTVTARTTTTKTAQKLITTVEIQLNATGQTIATGAATKYNATNNTIIKVTNYTSSKLAAFSAHEARGSSGALVYIAEVF